MSVGHGILIVSSLPLFVCLRVKCWMHTGFVGQCDETSIPYFILGYRVYRITIIIKIVTSNTSDSSDVGAEITPWLPPDTITIYSCILTTKNIQKNFQKRLAILFSLCYNKTIESKHTKHFGGNKLCLESKGFRSAKAITKWGVSVLSL